MVPFDQEMMTTSWRDYITEILVKRHHAIHLVAGHDHHFGHKNQGSPELLMQTCAELGLGCDIIPKVELGGITVSSSYIRRLVESRPTVDNGTDVTVEACLLDFDGDLYGETLRLEFFRHIRDEIRFDSLEALKSQIAADAETTRQAFLSGNLEGPPN